MSIRRLFVALAAALCVLSTSAEATDYTFRRAAGAEGGPGSVDGDGALARFNQPVGIIVDGSGTIYVADRTNNVIRVVDASGAVRTFAGVAGATCTSADGVRKDARFCLPADVAFDSHQNLFVAEPGGCRIRKVTPGGMVTTFAGGTCGYADGIGTAAQFTSPDSLAIDGSDTIWVADAGAHTIRRITPAGAVTTFAGSAGLAGSVDLTGAAARFNSPRGIAVDGAGNLYVGDSANHTIRKITPAAAVSTIAGSAGQSGYQDGTGAVARFHTPTGIAMGPDGNLAVADRNNHAIRKVSPAGQVVTWAGNTDNPCEGTDGLWSAASLCSPQDVFVDAGGATWFVDEFGHTVRKVTAALDVVTVAGMSTKRGSADGPIATATFKQVAGVIQRGTTIYMTDRFAIRAINLALGSVATAAGSVLLGGSVDANGTSARFGTVQGMVEDSGGNLFVCDTGNHTIRKIDGSWNVTTFAGGAGVPGAVDATGTNARFNQPAWIAIDATDTLYVTDRGNYTIRKITPDGVVTTLAGSAGMPGFDDGTGSSARFNIPTGIACDTSGSLYVSDGTRLRRVTSAGVVTTLAGTTAGGASDGTGSAANFSDLQGLAFAPDGALVAADYSLIRRITTAGVVTTIGGEVTQARSGTEEGTGSLARFYYPQGIGVSPAGSLLIAQESRLTIGSPRITDEATIDDTDGPLFVQRTLDSTPTTATLWNWRIVRRPAGSAALLSDATAPAPTFTPDVPDRYTFRLTATNSAGASSITDVSLVPPCPLLAFGPPSLPPGLIGLPYSQTLTVSNGTPPYRWEFQAGLLPPGVTISSAGQLTGTPATIGLYEFDVVAEDRYGCRGDGSYQIVVSNGPPNFLATGTAASVSLSWTDSFAALYKVFRKSAGTGFVQIGTTIAPSYSDTTVEANKAYVYYVKATIAAIDSAPSNSDLATTHVFTDDPLTTGTIVKLTHLNQLRSAVNSARSLAGLSLIPVTPETIILKEPLTTVRQAINEARNTFGIPMVVWTDIIPGVTKVSASHFIQLRNAVK